MIPRYQRILFWSLGGAILLMMLVLLRGCEQTREKLTRQRDETPLAAPIETPSETVHLALGNDASGTISMVDREIALPVESTARARVLLGRLLAEYTYKNSGHPLESGPAVDDVFLLDLPFRPAVDAGAVAVRKDRPDASGGRDPAVHSTEAATGYEVSTAMPHAPGGQMAVVNLRGTFADHHPSGIEAEWLTLESIRGTLYANFPRVEQVRFLVDGLPRETLAGHADLMRTYPVVDVAGKSGQSATAAGR